MFEFVNNMHWLTSSKRLLYLRHQRFCYESLSLFLGCIVAYHRNICQIFSLLFIPPPLSLNSNNCVNKFTSNHLLFLIWKLCEAFLSFSYVCSKVSTAHANKWHANNSLIRILFCSEEPSKPIWANSAWSHGRFYCHIPQVETAIPFPYCSSFTIHKSWLQNAMNFPCLLFRNSNLLTWWRCSKFF